jgi:flagella basal body P-ring formation protein FlgA
MRLIFHRRNLFGGKAQSLPRVLLIALAALGTMAQAGTQQQSFSRENAEAVLQQYILANAPWKPENVEVRMLPFQAISLPTGQVSYRIVNSTRGVTPGLHSFLVAADVGGKEAAKIWIKAEIKIFDEVVVSSYPLAHHEPLRAKDVRLERRDISSLSARPFTRIEDVAGQQAARAIEVNEILTQKSVDRPTVMRRGSPIVLVYETGALRVETPGIAEEGGKLGELIQVKNPTSGKLLRGVVIDGRTVRID